MCMCVCDICVKVFNQKFMTIGILASADKGKSSLKGQKMRFVIQWNNIIS